MIGGHSFPKLAMRVLPPWAFALLLLTTVMNHVLFSEALYLRAHKREPFLVQAVVVAIVLGISTLLLGRSWGANAVTVGYFMFGGLLSLAWGTYIFMTTRREWYGCSATGWGFGEEGRSVSGNLMADASRFEARDGHSLMKRTTGSPSFRSR